MSRKPNKVFTPGPTPIPRHILELGARQPPYNRTQAFSDLTFEILTGIKNIFQTAGDAVLLTASGTGAMEAAVLGFLKANDRALIVNGGTFGRRWADLCRRHSIPFEEIRLDHGKALSPEAVERALRDFSCNVLLLNAHETSTGMLYDVARIGAVALRLGVFFIVDAISSICADRFLMDEWSVDVAILSSQKALALPPGLSFIAFNGRAKKRLSADKPRSLYFDLLDYIENQKRGQMPYTPAIGLFVMLHQRLKDIAAMSLEATISRHEELAAYFRSKLREFPFNILPERSSNAMTALLCDEAFDASRLVALLEEDHGIFVASSGGDLRSKVFRVSHMGEQTLEDIDFLIQSLRKVALKYRNVDVREVAI